MSQRKLKDKSVADKLIEAKRNQHEQVLQEDHEKNIMERMFPIMWRYTDLDQTFNVSLLVIVRLLQVLFCTNTMAHPDEYWQSMEVAYKSVYGDRQNVWLPWEWSD